MFRLLAIILAVTFATANPGLAQSLAAWQSEFPNGDFSKNSVPYREFEYDGNTRDSIPPIYEPAYLPVAQATQYGDFEPVISVAINGDARAYPLQIMLWHEIVNDIIGGEPLLITYCPLCNSGVVFSRRVDQQILTFGNTGRIRNLDMVMFDHGSESWWQQFTGTAIMGSRTGDRMELIASRLESFEAFRIREPDGRVLVPNNPRARPYGTTPFAGMDSRRASLRFSRWPLPDGINPMQYVGVVGDKAWPLSRLRDRENLSEAGLKFSWSAGRNSLHDTRQISQGRDLGNVTVQNSDGSDAVYDVVFAFAFSAFIPGGEWVLGD